MILLWYPHATAAPAVACRDDPGRASNRPGIFHGDAMELTLNTMERMSLMLALGTAIENESVIVEKLTARECRSGSKDIEKTVRERREHLKQLQRLRSRVSK
jgi:hypothetical protein